METKYMTLRELKEKLANHTTKHLPTKAQMIASGDPIEIYQDDDYKIEVYPCGFAFVTKGRRYATVRVDACKDYTYIFKDSTLDAPMFVKPQIVTEAEFLNQPWPIRIMMEADDKFEESDRRREQRWLDNNPEIAKKLYFQACDTYGGNGFEFDVIAKVDKERAMETLTDLQREVFQLYDYGYSLYEIGEKIGISSKTACFHLMRACKKIIEFMK